MFFRSRQLFKGLSFLTGLALFLAVFAQTLPLCASSYAMASEDRSPADPVSRVSIKGDWFYVDGEKFFIKGIGYSPYRPGQKPGDDVPIELVEHDFKLIKEAGFNTIRTWSVLPGDILELSKKYGLMVIQGSDINLDEAMLNPEYLPKLLNMAQDEIRQAAIHDNILLILLANELPAEKVFIAGPDKAEKILKEFKQALDSKGAKIPVSISNSPQLYFMDNSFWDAACFNLYVFMPAAVFDSIGFRTFIELIIKKESKNKPLIVTEYGISISKSQLVKKLATSQYGFGGNTPQEQKQGTLFMLDEIVQAGATGACAFEWIDEWWKNFDTPDDWQAHDDEAEEWFGLLGFENEKLDPKGVPRPVYFALKEYNQAIMVEPKKMNSYSKVAPIEIYVTENIGSVEYRVNGGFWKKLKRTSPHWFCGKLKISPWQKKKEQLIQVRAKEISGAVHTREARIWTYGKKVLLKDPVSIKISTNKDKYARWESIKIKVEVKDASGVPLKDVTVDYAIFEPATWIQSQVSKATDKNGQVIIKYATSRPGALAISAGMSYKKDNYIRRFGDLITIKVQ